MLPLQLEQSAKNTVIKQIHGNIIEKF